MTISSFPHAAGEPYFREAGLKFLRTLKRNNRREWFEAHKPEFERELKQPMLALIETVNKAMEAFAPGHLRPPQKCMMRIYRDIRFSSDKRPYKSHISAWWSREGLEKTSGGGYYMHISPEEVLVAAGVYMPEREQLLAIRQHLLVHHAEVRQALTDRKLRRLMDSFTRQAAHTAAERLPEGAPGDGFAFMPPVGRGRNAARTGVVTEGFCGADHPAFSPRSAVGRRSQHASAAERREKTAATFRVRAGGQSTLKSEENL